MNETKYNALCLSSGGLYGSYMLGVLNHIDSWKGLNNIKYFIGSSAGSIICFLLLIGFKPLEILTYICTNDLSQIVKFNLLNITDGYGMYNINIFKDYVKTMILTKLDFLPTFQELYELTGKFFICTAYCLNKKKKTYFNHIDTPNYDVLDSVVASCAVPFIFTKHIIGEDFYTDGAVFDHFPLNKLYNILYKYENIDNIKVLSINIKTELSNNTNSYIEYISSVLNILIDTQIKEDENELFIKLEKKGNLDIINIDREEYALVDSVNLRIKYFCNGMSLAKDFFNKKKIKRD